MTEQNFSLSNRYSNSLLKLGVVCRGCLHLGLDIKLADAKTCQEFFSEVAGLGVESYQNGFLCLSCVRRMKKVIAYRDSVRRVNDVLNNIAKTKVTLQWLTETRASLQDETLSLSEAVLVECLPSGDEAVDWDDAPEETHVAADSDGDEQKVVVEENSNGDLLMRQFGIDNISLGQSAYDMPSSSRVHSIEHTKIEYDPKTEVEEHDAKADETTFHDDDFDDAVSSPSDGEKPERAEEAEKPERAEEADNSTEAVLYHCHVCDRAISCKDTYTEHVQSHQKIGPFRCNLCSNYFSSDERLAEHKARHSMQFQCSLCEFKKREKPLVMRHYAIKHIGLTHDLKCPVCSEDLSERLLCLKSHSCLSMKVKCANCEKEMERIVLHQHEKQHRGEKLRYECGECGQCFRHAIGVVEHKAKKHGKQRSAHDESYYCVECDATYPNQGSYKRHITYTVKHAREDLLKQCPECPVRLLRGALKRHILREHVKEPPLTCELCPKRFFTKRGLVEHRDYRHYGVPRIAEKKYTCETCGRLFSSKQFLTRHLNVHLGLKPFQCKECGKRFPYDSGLYTHVLMVHRKLKRDSHGRFYKRDDPRDEVSRSVRNLALALKQEDEVDAK